MEFHPIIVNFSLALLVLYTILECIRFRKILHNRDFFETKSSLVIIGSILIWIAGNDKSTGIAVVFSLIAFAYFITWIRSRLMGKAFMTELSMHPVGHKVWMLFDRASRIIRIPSVNITLALFGLVLIGVFMYYFPIL